MSEDFGKGDLKHDAQVILKFLKVCANCFIFITSLFVYSFIAFYLV